MKKKQNNEEYNKYIETITPKSNQFKNCLNAFLAGGLICTLGQLILNICKNQFGLSEEDSAGYTSIILVAIIAKYAGAGALVPITGFANSIAAPTIEYQKEGEVFGKGVKVFTIAGPVILFGILTSFLAGLIYYLLKITGIM